MVSLKSIPLASIAIGERARPVDVDHAAAIAGSMVDRGLINPITVRNTPAAKGGKTPYTLIAGGHRLEAARMNGWEEIDAIVLTADSAEAQLIEISENLYRNELSALDRGLFVTKFREIYEEKHGKVERGGDRKSKSNDWTLIFAPGKELSERVQERLGIGRSTYFNLTLIGQKLDPTLRQAVRGTAAEYDQKKLLKLAKLSRDEQVKVAAALREDNNVDTVFDWLKGPKATPSAESIQAGVLKKLLAAWDDASAETREDFLQQIGMGGSDALMQEIREDAA
ncbi:transcriptional regulator [Agrobacterium vitis]|uniref:ParB N-terminal domain-containing protein n=1 Tax=Allorhizobium ampelinum TaxID=3025782 RepID=UPI001F3BAEBC|nr:ParB N-terminal domain-containing protein [Allorhizobium ampelinum]MCF1449957.1 transcriptional regulator [Allorhizobium ampelinum]